MHLETGDPDLTLRPVSRLKGWIPTPHDKPILVVTIAGEGSPPLQAPTWQRPQQGPQRWGAPANPTPALAAVRAWWLVSYTTILTTPETCGWPCPTPRAWAHSDEAPEASFSGLWAQELASTSQASFHLPRSWPIRFPQERPSSISKQIHSVISVSDPSR